MLPLFFAVALILSILCQFVSTLHTDTRPFLKANDSICIVAASGVLDEGQQKQIGMAQKWLKETYDLNCFLGKNLFKKHNAFAGTDQEKLEDLKWAMDPKTECKAVLFGRGGYGLNHVVDRIVNEGTMKFLIGFSDVTHVLLSGYKLGFPVHGPMPGFENFRDPVNQGLFDYIMEGREYKGMNLTNHPLNKKGKGKGLLIGGNLTIFVSNLGTKNDPPVHGNILFLEDVHSSIEEIDRKIRHLARANKLTHIQGLVLGEFAETHNDQYFPEPWTPEKLIMDILEEYGYDFPIAFRAPFGHATNNKALPIGIASTLTVNENGDAYLSFD